MEVEMNYQIIELGLASKMTKGEGPGIFPELSQGGNICNPIIFSLKANQIGC